MSLAGTAGRNRASVDLTGTGAGIGTIKKCPLHLGSFIRAFSYKMVIQSRPHGNNVSPHIIGIGTSVPLVGIRRRRPGRWAEPYEGCGMTAGAIRRLVGVSREDTGA